MLPNVFQEWKSIISALELEIPEQGVSLWVLEVCMGQCVPCCSPGFWCFGHKFYFLLFLDVESIDSKGGLELIFMSQPPSAGIRRVCHYTRLFYILTLIQYPIFVFIFMWHSPMVHACLYTQMSPFYKNTGILN